MHIDHGGAEFPFEQFARLIRERIKAGTYPPGSKIPSLIEFGAETELSTMTMRRGIKVLVDEGLLRVRAGWGTFVAKPPKDDVDT